MNPSLALVANLLMETEDELKSLSEGPYHTASMWYYAVDGIKCIHLQSIKVKKDAPAGTSTSFMQDLIRIADREDRWITLDVGSRDTATRKTDYKKTTSSGRLMRWYSSLGFRRNASKGLFQLRGTMHRAPNLKYKYH